MALVLIEGNVKVYYDDSDGKQHVVQENGDGTTTDLGTIESGVILANN